MNYWIYRGFLTNIAKEAYKHIGEASHWGGRHELNPKDDIFLRLICACEVLLQKLHPDRLVVTHSKVSMKFVGKEMRWLPHQDSAYHNFKGRGYTVCVFLEKVTKNSGCLVIHPGSEEKQYHHSRISKTGDFFNQLCISEPIQEVGVSIIGDVGDVLIFDSRMVHQSGNNTVGGKRAMYIFEVELFRPRLSDEGNVPIVLGGSFSRFELLIAKARFFPRRIRPFLVKVKRWISLL